MHSPRPNTGARPVDCAQDISNPHLREVYDIWADAAEECLPHPEVFDPLEFLESARSWLIYDITEACHDFVVRFAGTEAVAHIGHEATGMTKSEIRQRFGDEFANRVSEALKLVADERKPILVGPRSSAIRGKAFAIIESLTLPLSTDGAAVDRALNVAKIDRAA